MKFLLLAALVVSAVGIAVGSAIGGIGEIDDTEIVLSHMPLVAAAGLQ